MLLPQSKYNTVLFDWDGCIADTLAIWMSAYLNVYKEYGLSLTAAQVVEKSWGNWEKGPLNFGIQDNMACMDKILDKVFQDTDHVQLNEGVANTLKTIRDRGYKMAIISSSKRKQIEPNIIRLHIEYFNVLLCEEDVTNVKPNPEIANKAMQLLNADPRKTILVGDSGGDIKTASNAGVDSVLYYPKSNELYYEKFKLLQTHPTFVINEFSKLTDILS